jgi:hypothetical protein
MDLKDRDELAVELGTKVLESADYLRLFMPEYVAKIPCVWCGQTFIITVELSDD